MPIFPLIIMACSTSSPPAPPHRLVVVTNASAQVFPSVAILAEGQVVQPAQPLAPGRIVVASVPEGPAAVEVGQLSLALPESGGVTAIMDTQGVDWAVGPLLWGDPPAADADLLPWGSQLSEDLATGSLDAALVSRLAIYPWAKGDRWPERFSQLSGGRTITDPAGITAFLAAVEDAHRRGPTGELTGGKGQVVVADLQPQVQAWFAMVVAPQGLRV
ncbi:MAG: hypothetical protein GXP62_03425, partial [Oligoflexia bacterium]|nr:hypothetical protein [Oligoflexia bacterium]